MWLVARAGYLSPAYADCHSVLDTESTFLYHFLRWEYQACPPSVWRVYPPLAEGIRNAASNSKLALLWRNERCDMAEKLLIGRPRRG